MYILFNWVEIIADNALTVQNNTTLFALTVFARTKFCDFRVCEKIAKIKTAKVNTIL